MTVGLASFGSTFPGATGKTVLGGFSNFTSMMFMNFAKQAASLDGQLKSAGSDPSGMNADGYPVTTSPSGCSSLIIFPNIPNQQWVLKWRNNVAGGFLINTTVTVVAVGGTVGGITYGNGGSTVTGNPVGFLEPFNVTRPRIVFTFGTPGVSAIVNFPTGVTYHGNQDVVICRIEDEAALDRGEIFTPEWLAAMRALNPKVIRAMGSTLNAGNDATMAMHTGYRPTVNAFSYSNTVWQPGLWAGSITNTGDAYSVGTFTDYATLGGAYVEGMMLQGTLKGATTNTTTTPTLNLNSLGAKTILNAAGQPFTISGLALTNCTFIYDAVLDGWLYHEGGMTYGPPLEIKIAACNALKKDYWHTIPINYTLASCSTDAAYIAANLNPGLNCYVELCNENWNTGFNQYAICALRGRAFGFSVSGNQDALGYQGLRSRQIFPLFATAFATRSSTLKRVLAVQAGGGVDNSNTNLFLGDPLAIVANGGAASATALWNSYTGSANYRTVGQRPVDFCEVISYAPYIQPAQVGQADVDYTGPGGANITLANMTDIIAYADLYAAGGASNIATALAGMDTLWRRGTWPVKTVTSVSGGNTFNVTSHGYTAGKVLIFPSGSFTGISSMTVYYVISTGLTTNAFQVSLSISGSAVTGISLTGTGTVGRSQNSTMLDYDVGFNATSGTLTIAGVYNRWEAMAALYSKDVVCYEAGPLQGCGPTTGCCTSLGISTSYGDTFTGSTITSFGKIGTLINAYKDSALGRQFVIDQYKQFAGTDATSPNFGLLPHSKYVAALAFEGQSQWSLYPGDIITTAPYQIYYGVQTYNNS